MRLTMLCLTYSLFLFGCASGLNRPNAPIYFMNAAAKQKQGNNILKDYDNNGVRTASGFTITLPLNSVQDVDRMFCTDAPGFKAIKTSLADARNYLNNHCTCK